MKSPIIVCENGDISIFKSVAEAERYLEPIDVSNHEYVAYDAEGCLLDLGVIAVSRSAWFGLSRYYVDGVKIGPSEDLPGHAADLKKALSEFLPELGVSDSWTRTASLEELLDKTIHHVGYC